ncbi:MAG: hypothetical protein DRP94_07100 [Candidatus Latescibacterota bacterium]|nr:MAG: hypothetical protein DRP94_07100 [Candidatus Latescibacterota bacterium]HDH99566.1 hypothetical protein [Bacillota bacterium]
MRFLAFATVVLFWGPLAGAQELPGIAVMDFESIGGDPHLGPGVAENLRTALIQTGQFKVIERAALQKVLEEQKLQITGLVDPQSAIKLGKLVGAKLIVVGSVVKFAEAYTLNVRFIDAETGVAIKAEKVQASSEAEIPRMIDRVVEMIVGIYPKGKPTVVPTPQKPSLPDAVVLARQQAEGDVNKTMWMGAGFLLGLPGVILAYIVEPSPPTAALVGKPPEYTATYIRAYKEKAREIQAKYAFYGCLIGSAVTGCLYASALSSAETQTYLHPVLRTR